MENVVFLAVLFAAACHAGWNALIKVGLDPLSTTTLISLGAGLVALAFVPLVGVPAWAAWPWLIASVLVHLFYFASLIESYRTGDLGQVYPIARRSTKASSRPPRADSSSTPTTSARIPPQPIGLSFSPTKSVVTVAVINGADPRAIG